MRSRLRTMQPNSVFFQSFNLSKMTFNLRNRSQTRRMKPSRVFLESLNLSKPTCKWRNRNQSENHEKQIENHATKQRVLSIIQFEQDDFQLAKQKSNEKNETKQRVP